MHKRAGDTLIEVTLAVGIFSMVAISAAAVMSGGTSSAQTALETTLAREEIDTQAEALRFIHSAYLADENSGNEPYTELWRTITSIKTDDTEDNAIFGEYDLDYTPTSCQEVYDSELFQQYGFVIDTKVLGGEEPTNAYIKYSKNNALFDSAVTYPHLVYDGDTFLRAEGIYVIAVKDPGTTNLVNEKGDVDPNQSGYYDFYIRTCWYGTSSEIPSTISTVIRLYDPPEAVSRATPRVKIRYNIKDNGKATYEGKTSQVVYADNSIELTPPTELKRSGWEFLNWYLGADVEQKLFSGHNSYNLGSSGKIECSDGKCTYYAPETIDKSIIVNINADWEHLANTITYDPNGGSGELPSTLCYLDEEKCTLSNVKPTYVGRDFAGWAETEGASEGDPNYAPGTTINQPGRDIKLYAVWVYHPDTVFLIDSSSSMDNMIIASKEALKNVTNVSTKLGGKVALFDYNNKITSGAKMLCGFQETDNIYKCTKENIGTYISSISLDSGESLPKALNFVLDKLDGQWTESYLKTIIIVTDEYIGDNESIKGFATSINNQKISPLNIYIVTNCENENNCNKTKYKDLFDDAFANFDGVDITITTIETPGNPTTTSFWPVRCPSSRFATGYCQCDSKPEGNECKKAITAISDGLSNILK